jgi:release factor glutamine methyltransferase
VTVKQALTLAETMLAANNNIDAPKIIAEVLLRHVTRKSRVELYLDLNVALSPENEKQFRQVIQRQINGEPVAYITGHREFYGLDFSVDSRVLIPRPESELLVEEALRTVQNKPHPSIAEIGTGSGAVAISIAVHAAGARIYATDISASALEVARLNCQTYKVDGRTLLLQGDLLGALPGPVDVLIANLPYVRRSEVSAVPSAKYEPLLALDGGESGLEKIFRLCSQVCGKLNSGGCLLLEVGMGQSPAVTDRLKSLFAGAKVQVIPDLSGIGRVVRMDLI